MKTRFTQHAVRSLAIGMTLLEVIMALALFSSVAVALTSAINAIGQATIESRDLRNVEQMLEGIMDEESKKPQIVEVDKEIKAGANGVSFHVKVAPVTDLRTQNDVQLNGLFRIVVVARWKMDGSPMQLTAETMRYAGMFMPVQ